jgi:L-alanine-DL-glutamate epimerase-like enolase superfamily enzyme
MEITSIDVTRFSTTSRIIRDSEGHTHPGERHASQQSIVSIHTDAGVTGRCLGSIPEPVLNNLIAPLLVGQHPLYRERIWQTLMERQRLNLGRLSDRILAVVDMALWDLGGILAGQPVHQLLGGMRDSVPAYASTMCGDDIPGGLDTPEAYAEFALACMDRGYPAFKLHTWQPPYAGAPDTQRDIAACRAVREAVGPDVPLMLDPYHFYTRAEALRLALALETLDYAWMEEPMDEHSMASYVWLCQQTLLPICGPETAEGKLQTRAEWVLAGAADILRGGVGDVGGITPLIKIAHLAEAYGMRMEVHGGGVGNLHVLCAMGVPGAFYERGLLHPFVDYDEVPPYFNSLVDPMDSEGNVHVSQAPGLGWDFNWDYIEKHRLN